MSASFSTVILLFLVLLGMVMINSMAYLADRRKINKAKPSEGLTLFQWPLPLIYSGLILLFMASALTESMPITNVVLIGFAGIALLGFGFLRLTNPYGIFTGMDGEKKKKNEDINSYGLFLGDDEEKKKNEDIDLYSSHDYGIEQENPAQSSSHR